MKTASGSRTTEVGRGRGARAVGRAEREGESDGEDGVNPEETKVQLEGDASAPPPLAPWLIPAASV